MRVSERAADLGYGKPTPSPFPAVFRPVVWVKLDLGRLEECPTDRLDGFTEGIDASTPGAWRNRGGGD
jgi:hypothetical protein